MSVASVYNARYAGEYRQRLSGYEIARWRALEHFIRRVLELDTAKAVLDYGAGSGLHVALWEKVFPSADLYFADISSVAIDKLKSQFPRYAEHCFLVHDHRADVRDEGFDVVASVEVMEHVEDLTAYLSDVFRVLKPGGYFIWTTPCANPFSIEHLCGKVTGQIDPTKEGYRRWRWEDPTHLRRLTSDEAAERLKRVGFSQVDFRFRAHVFSFVVTCLPSRFVRRLCMPLMYLDYSAFRRLPNGASMIGVARKPRR